MNAIHLWVKYCLTDSYTLHACVLSCFSCDWLCVTPWTVAWQALLSSTTLRVCSNSCLLSWWCCSTISSSAPLSSFCLQSFPASGSFPMRWLFTSGGQNTRASASASVLPVNSPGWFHLGLTDLILYKMWKPGNRSKHIPKQWEVNS